VEDNAEPEEEEQETEKEEEKEIRHPEIRIEVEEEKPENKAPATPRAQRKKGMPLTPEAPRFGLDTPPDTRRVTRSTAKALDKTPGRSPSGPSTSAAATGGRLAFADFRVTKSKGKDLIHDTKPSTRKRAADQTSAPAAKRTRT
jgi:hypothetical protein